MAAVWQATLEFFPERKYHIGWASEVQSCLTPMETVNISGKMSGVWKKNLPLVFLIGLNSWRTEWKEFIKEGANGFESLVPLPEVISACVGVSSRSKKVQKEYEQMLRMIGPEFEILRTVPLEEIRQKSGFLIAEGIERLRNGEVERIPGFDGEYGTIKLFQPYELEEVDRQR